MRDAFDLKSIEKKVYRSTYQDGLWELFFGLMLLGITLSVLLDEGGVPVLWRYFVIPFPAILVLNLGKRYITVPRIGIVKFSPVRQQAEKKQKLFLALFTAVTFLSLNLIVSITVSGELFERFGSLGGPVLLSFLFFALPLFVLAWFRDYPGLYVIGFLYWTCWPAAEVLSRSIAAPLDTVLSFGLCGLLISLYGLSMTVRFIRKYPLNSVEVDHG